VANADIWPKIAEVPLARNFPKLYNFHRQQRQQTEPLIEVELADGSPVQEVADVAPDGETPRGEGVA
jgi:hypothetical protein